MTGDIIDYTAPSLQNGYPRDPKDLPHGLITPPDLVRQLLAKEKAKHPPEVFNAACEERMLNQWTLAYYFDYLGHEVVYRQTPAGPEVLAVGDQERLALRRALGEQKYPNVPDLDVLMNQLAIAVTGKTLWATGDVRLWISLNLLLKDNTGGWQMEEFRVDTGTDITTFPAHLAKQLNLPIPIQASSGVAHTQVGLEIRSGVLPFQIDGMDATEYVVPCFFLGDPDTPPSGPPGTLPRKLLQPLALLDQLHFRFDKNATVGAPYGEMVIEKK